jgi:hypothetical protein
VTESELFEAIRKLARLTGWAMYHTHDSRRSEPGFPDLVLMRPPRILFRELKTETGRVTPAQQKWLDELTACGADAAVWRPRDITNRSIPGELSRVPARQATP